MISVSRSTRLSPLSPRDAGRPRLFWFWGIYLHLCCHVHFIDARCLCTLSVHVVCARCLCTSSVHFICALHLCPSSVHVVCARRLCTSSVHFIYARCLCTSSVHVVCALHLCTLSVHVLVDSCREGSHRATRRRHACHLASPSCHRDHIEYSCHRIQLP